MRTYESCPRCFSWLVKIDDSQDTFGDPPAPSIGWYLCPNCHEQVMYYRRENTIRRGFHPDDVQRFVRDGKITAEGRLVAR